MDKKIGGYPSDGYHVEESGPQAIVGSTNAEATVLKGDHSGRTGEKGNLKKFMLSFRSSEKYREISPIIKYRETHLFVNNYPVAMVL